MKKLLIIAVLLTAGATIPAQEAGLQLSLIPDVALHPTSTTIHGLSLNFCGQNKVRGVDLGIINITSGESYGLSLSLINWAGSYSGAQLGGINVSKDKFAGWQFGGLNYSGGVSKGLQLGLINAAAEFRGLQLGCVNYADKLHGLQIGVINIVTDNPWFVSFPDRLAAAFPIVNWSF